MELSCSVSIRSCSIVKLRSRSRSSLGPALVQKVQLCYPPTSKLFLGSKCQMTSNQYCMTSNNHVPLISLSIQDDVQDDIQDKGGLGPGLVQF